MLYSFDGGQSGNLFAGHYFDFNKKHLDGTLMEAVIGRPGVELKKHTTLLFKPLNSKPIESAEKKKSRKDAKTGEF